MNLLVLLALGASFQPTAGVAVSCLENIRGKSGRARVEVVVGAGCLQEGESERGVAHLVEHLVLRPLGFDDNNGATGWDYTSYYQDVRADEVLDSAKALLTNIRAPKIAEHEVELEKKVVLRELMDRGTANLERQADPIFGDTLLARYPGGTASSVSELDADDVASFHARHYVRGNIAVVISGATDCEAVRRELEPLLEPFPAGAASDVPETGSIEPGRRALPTRSGDYVAGFYWYRASLRDEIIYQLVFQHLQQRALQDLRKERGMTYSPTSAVLRRGPGGQARLSVRTEGEDSAVADWYDEALQDLLTSESPREHLREAVSEVREALERDGVRAGLAAIRGRSQPVDVLEEIQDTTLRTDLPRLLDDRRALGSAIPQSNLASLLVLVLFGGLVLGGLYWAYKAYAGS